jgi:hypothetical protein
MNALFKSHVVRFGDDRRSLLVEGRLESGEVRAGMFLKIDFNPRFGMTVLIADVFQEPSGRMVLRLDCEDEDGAQFVEAMNFGNERLEILTEG